MKTLKYAVRFLMRSRSYTIINLLGLAFSLACCIILLRYIHRELTVDTHCVDREKVYAVKVSMEGDEFINGFSAYEYDSVSIDKRYIAQATSYTPLEKDFIYVDNQRFMSRTLVTDSVFFQLFSYPVVQGKIGLDKPESVLLKKDFAQKIFGNKNPIGKVIRHSNGKDLVVEGIIDEPDCKTSLRFDMVLSYELSTQWEQMASELYRFVPGTDMEEMNKIGSIPRYMNDPQWDTRQFTFSFLPVEEIYWHGELNETEETMNASNTWSRLWIICGVCLLMLLTGTLNFVNLYLVTMLRRGKEYGLKKVYGANGRRIFQQIWTENTLLVFAALMVAWLMVEVTQIPVNRLLEDVYWYSPFDFWLSLGLLALLPLITSVYPFIKYNYAPPIRSIRSIGWGSRSVRSRMTFLGIQYVLTFLLITFALYFDRQLNLMLNTEPGFRTHDILKVKLVYRSQDYGNYSYEKIMEDRQKTKLLFERLKTCPLIEAYHAYDVNMTGSSFTTLFTNGEGKQVAAEVRYAAPSFFDLFEIDILEGTLTQELADGEMAVVANQETMRQLGYTSLEGAKIMETDAVRKNPTTPLSPIVAVVEDYYPGHLVMGKRPIIYKIAGNFAVGDSYQIAYSSENKKRLIEFLENLSEEIYGSKSLEFSFMEDEVKAIYNEDRKIASIYTIFALIAIAISCLGLFGISLFDIRQRYREIGIRKINGAGMKDLYKLLFRKYVVVLGAAFVVAVPIAYYLITMYTRDFAIKAPVGIGLFVVALLVVAVISLGTLFWQVRRAANINPADVMKTE